jgi:hypothetical protein
MTETLRFYDYLMMLLLTQNYAFMTDQADNSPLQIRK